MKLFFKCHSRESKNPSFPPDKGGLRGVIQGLALSHEQRQDLRQLCPPPTRRGLGLVEVLVASGIGIALSMGALESLKLTVNSAHIVKTNLEEQRLTQEVKNYFSEEQNCKQTLKPLRLAEDDRVHQSGLILNREGTALKEIGSWTPSLLSIKGIELLNSGTDKSHPTRTLVVLYTKPYLAAGQETLNGGECSATDKSGCYYHTCILDYKCNDNCSSEDDRCQPVTCHSSQLQLAGVSCPAGQSLVGFDENGDKICKSIHPCPDGEVPSGVWTEEEPKPDGVDTGDPKCLPVVALSSTSEEGLLCPDGQVVRQINRDGTLECTGLCEELQEWKWDDDTKTTGRCECVEGTVWDPLDMRCECQHSKKEMILNGECRCLSGHGRFRVEQITAYNGPYLSYINRLVSDENADCQKCPQEDEGGETFEGYVLTNDRCECPAHKKEENNFLWNVTVCSYRCGGSKPIWDNDSQRCVPCPSDKPKANRLLNNCSTCHESTPYFYNDGCHRCKQGERRIRGQYRYYCCPINKPYYHNEACRRCPSSLFYENRCHPCPQGQNHHSGGCYTCTAEYYYNDRCNQCLEGQHFHHGRCNPCPRGQHHYNNRCNPCAQGQHHYNNRCNQCPQATPHHYSNRCNKCPQSQEYVIDGILRSSGRKMCCGGNTGYYNSNGYCCPNGSRDTKGKCCKYGLEVIPDDRGRKKCCGGSYYNANGLCCLLDEHNSNGHCCLRGLDYLPLNRSTGQKVCCGRWGYTHNSNGLCCYNGFRNINGTCRLISSTTGGSGGGGSSGSSGGGSEGDSPDPYRTGGSGGSSTGHGHYGGSGATVGASSGGSGDDTGNGGGDTDGGTDGGSGGGGSGDSGGADGPGESDG